MLDLRHFRYFVAVAEELHFGRAAVRLHMAQPPLSQQIQAMEAILGVRLFERTRRKVELTEAGRMLLDEARAALAQAARAEDVARRAARGELGRLEIGFTGSSPFTTAMPTLVGRFRRAWPQVRLSLREMSTSDQMVALAEGRVDIGFARPAGEIAVPGIRLRLIQREPLLVVCNDHHPLAGSGRVTMEQLAGEAFILHPRHIGTGLYDRVMGLARTAGYIPRVEIEAHQMSTMVSLAAIGLGIAIVPDAMRRVGVDGAAFLALVDSMAYVDLFVAHRDGPPTRPVANFLELVGERA
jgi:DNA-binding transcriptional LysR family regulator